MSPKYIAEWRDKAEQDFQVILIVSRQRKKQLPNIICFHAQQCAEKYLKALLAKHKIPIPKAHDLIFLADQLAKEIPDLELIKDMLRQLTRYAVEFRYPGESATQQEAKRAVHQIEQIRKFLIDKF